MAVVHEVTDCYVDYPKVKLTLKTKTESGVVSGSKYCTLLFCGFFKVLLFGEGWKGLV